MYYLIFGIVLAVVLAVTDAIDSWLFSWLLYLLAGLGFLAIRVVAKPAKMLTVSRRLSRSNIAVGQSVQVYVAVDWQGGAGPGWVYLEDTLPDSMRALTPSGHLDTIGGGTDISFSYRITGAQRGYYPIGPVSLTVGDLFGLLQKTQRGEDQVYLTVYPKIHAIPKLRIASNRPIGDARSSKRLYEDTTRLVGVRDYQSGDPLSRIHWKTTARLGHLATKLSEPSTSIEVNILLNLYYGDYPQERDEMLELACTTAASVASGLIADKHLVGLQTNGYDRKWEYGQASSKAIQLRPGRGPQQAEAILSVIGRLNLSGSPNLLEYLTNLHSHLPWTATTLLITHRLPEEATAALDELKRAGFELAVIIIGAGEDAEASRLRAAALGIPTALVQTEAELAYLDFWRPR